MFTLPGCPRDGMRLASGPDADAHCALTMDAACAARTGSTLLELVAQERAGGGFNVPALEQRAARVQQHAPLQLQACSHVFAAAELLFLLALRGFRCPVCRQGSGDRVDLAHAQAPAGVQEELWGCLRELATAARRRHESEHAQEEEDELNEMLHEELQSVQLLSSGELLQRCAFDLTVACYMTPVTSVRNHPNIPRTSVTVQLRPGALESSRDADGCLVLRVAHGRHRTISANINRSKHYTANVFIQLQDFEDELFPVLIGKQRACPRSEGHGSARRTREDSFVDAERQSELQIAYESCSYTGEYMIRSITFRMHEDTFREQVFAALERAILA
jgi:hypothetical protein